MNTKPYTMTRVRLKCAIAVENPLYLLIEAVPECLVFTGLDFFGRETISEG